MSTAVAVDEDFFVNSGSAVDQADPVSLGQRGHLEGANESPVVQKVRLQDVHDALSRHPLPVSWSIPAPLGHL